MLTQFALSGPPLTTPLGQPLRVPRGADLDVQRVGALQLLGRGRAVTTQLGQPRALLDDLRLEHPRTRLLHEGHAPAKGGMSKVQKRPQVELDILEIGEHIAAESSRGTAHRFIDDLEGKLALYAT